MVTIMLLAHNEAKFAELAVKFIRKNAVGVDVELVLIDNASTDGLREWASLQTDFTYVYMDQGTEPWGCVLSQVVKELRIKTDILLMQSRMILTPDCLSVMYRELHSDEFIGIVGCVTSEALTRQQRPVESIYEYEEAVKYSESHISDGVEKVLGVESGILMIKHDLLDSIGGFDERIGSLYVLAKDLALSALHKGYHSVICHNAVAHEIPTGYPESLDTLQYMSEDGEVLQSKWNMHYFNMAANDLIVDMVDEMLRKDVKVLEIGCDCGATLLMIKHRHPDYRVIGCDISAAAVETAKFVLDEAFVANIENKDLPFEKNSLDYVIFGDVLEHLRDPTDTLRYISTLLKEDGRVIASIPNVMHISVMRQLLHGDFEYTDAGLLDRTHIHLFTYNEIKKMFKATGYRVEHVGQKKVMLNEEDEHTIEGLLNLGGGAERFMYETFQYLVKATLE